jgi:hypothetical protein
LTPTPTVVDDVRHLDCGPDAARLAGVRLGRAATLVILSAADKDGARHVDRIVATIVVPHPDWQPGPNDASASALAVLAASYQLCDGESYALRVWAR